MTGLHTAGAVGAALIQVALVGLGAPYLTGLMRQLRARIEGRAGPGVGQPMRDLRKLLRKESTRPEGTSVVFVAAPLVMLSTAIFLAAVVPFISTVAPMRGVSDLFAVVAIFLLGTVSLALAALDTGTAFGGIGASREATIIALVEPTILLSIFALSVRVGSSNLTDIVAGTLTAPTQVLSPASLLLRDDRLRRRCVFVRRIHSAAELQCPGVPRGSRIHRDVDQRPGVLHPIPDAVPLL